MVEHDRGSSWTPLNPDCFRLVDFRNPRALAAARITTCGIFDDAPVIREYRDALYHPARKADAGYVGGITDLAGAPIPDTALRRSGNVIKSRLEAPVHGEVHQLETAVWLGWFFHHFGHFLLEGLSRAWALEELDPSIPVIFHEPVPGAYSGVRETILCGIRRERGRVVGPRGPTRIDRLLVPSAAYELKWAAHPRFVEPLRSYAERLVGNDPPTEQPVYLSRSRLRRSKRPIMGEREFEEILESRGFLVVHPEELPIEEQIRTINRHRHIFAANGSAAHLIVFCLRRPHLHLLTQERLSQDFFLCSAIADVSTTMVQCLDLVDDATSGATAFTVNFDSALRYLHDEGFGRSTSALTGWGRRS